MTSGNVIKGRSRAHIDKMAAKRNGTWRTSTARVGWRAGYVTRSAFAEANSVPASINRHTGEPHEHKREIARHDRQKDRLHHNYMLNGGFTRRGNEAGPVAGYEDWVAIGVRP